MKNKASMSLMFYLVVLVLASCNLPMGSPHGPYYTPTPSGADLTLTAAMAITLDAAPSNTPPAWATLYPPAPGELGWGRVYGTVFDGLTLQPVTGATVRCEHFSYSTPYVCKDVTTTDAAGKYEFTDVLFHDRDRLTLIAEAPGYGILRLPEQFVTRAELHTDLYLFPPVTDTPTSTPDESLVVCTPPSCEGGTLACGLPGGCLGGCGTICKMPTP